MVLQDITQNRDLSGHNGSVSTSEPDRCWTDNFEGPAGQPPDPAVWSHELGGGGWGWGCEQLQHSTSSSGNAALTSDGHLAITARQEADGRVTSARIITKRRVTTRYGRIEARIKVPAEPGTWPAFRMLGHDIDRAGWPACGEIDVMDTSPSISLGCTEPSTVPATAAWTAAPDTPMTSPGRSPKTSTAIASCGHPPRFGGSSTTGPTTN